MRIIHEFEKGCFVQDAAYALLAMAKVTGEKQEGIFNGRLMVAEWNSTVEQVLDRWHEAKTCDGEVMVQLSDLYDADKSVTRLDVASMRATHTVPHPLHGVDYADGVILCGRTSCEPCRAYKGLEPYWKIQDRRDLQW